MPGPYDPGMPGDRLARPKRSLAWRLVRWGLATVAILLVLGAAWYGYWAWRFFGGKPDISHDYLAELNAPILATPPQDRAWPAYREALVRPGAQAWLTRR